MFFQTGFTIDSRDLDCFEHCRPSRLLGYLQESSALAMHELDADNATMLSRYGCCWMISRLKFTLDVPLMWRDELTIKTWHRGGTKAILYRDADLFVNGRLCGEALAAWVLVDVKTRAPARLSSFPFLLNTDGGPLNRSTVLPRLKAPDGLSPATRRTLHYSDLDGNGHVNNTRYADFFCDALHLEQKAPTAFVRTLQLDFLHECKADEELVLRSFQSGSQGFVSGEDPNGSLRFQASGLFA